MDQPTPVPPTPTSNIPPSEPPDQWHWSRRRQGFSVWRLFIGLFIILVGLSFLAQQFGWNWLAPADVWKLWPVFIILVGLSMVFRGRVMSTVLGIILSLAVLALVGMMLFWPTRFSMNEHRNGTIAAALQSGATMATVTLNLGAAKITIDGGSSQLFDGAYDTSFGPVVVDEHLDGTTQQDTLHQDRANGWWFGSHQNTVDLHFSDTAPLNLNVDTGAADLTLDASTLTLKHLTVNAGASSLNLKLGPAMDNGVVAVKAGASSIRLTAPKSVGVKLSVDSAVSGKTLPEFTNLGSGQYISANNDTVDKHVSVSIDAGASSIQFIWE